MYIISYKIKCTSSRKIPFVLKVVYNLIEPVLYIFGDPRGLTETMKYLQKEIT